jgi:hypothetical protein
MRASIVGIIAVVGLALSADAQTTIVPSNAPFVDISVSGTSVGAIADDSETTVPGATHGWIGNELLAGGVSFRVGNNGCVIWGNSATDTFTNATEVGYLNPNINFVGATSIGTMTAANGASNGNGGLGPRQMLAVCWDDNIPGTGGSIKWQVIGPDLIIQWTNEDHFNAAGSGVITYEMIAHGGVTLASGLPLVEFVYQDTQYAPSQYQNDGGSASIGFKNWGVNGGANDAEWGLSGGSGGSTSDPAFGGTNMQPKVAGYLAADNPNLPHALAIIPAPGSLALLGLGGLLARRRRR